MHIYLKNFSVFGNVNGKKLKKVCCMDAAVQESKNFACKILGRNPKIHGPGFSVPRFRQCKWKKMKKNALVYVIEFTVFLW